MKKKKIVVAIDSFKGSATSQELNQAVKKGIHSIRPDIVVEMFEIADGGEGTISALYHRLGGQIIEVDTVDLLKRPMKASYLLFENKAFIEAAEVVGIDKIEPSERTILLSSTEGLAPLFLDAKTREAKEIILSLGGTGTSDGGLGLLKALGAKVENLVDFEDIDCSTLEDFSAIKIIGMADVKNPYAGAKGFAQYFGKQKGGTPPILDAQGQQSQKVVEKVKTNYGIDLQSIPGTGAAGGLGGALVLLGGTIEPGFKKIAQLLNIEESIKESDLVITGEGRMDYQTVNGKVPYAIAKLAEKHGVPTIAFCGALSDELGKMDEVLLASFSIQQSALSLQEAMEKERTLTNIEFLAQNVIKLHS
ncbi:glycerate kinase family protein [Lactococcus garvieae]|uniref:glycerate kinase family protein n=1 Tax=Lactococcus garvieae TaxID=1363 RepID=UPI003853A43D